MRWHSLALAAVLVLLTSTSSAQQFLYGTWAGRDGYGGSGDYTVRFHKTGTYEYIKWGKTREGAWEFGREVCWRVEKSGAKGRYGNLMIYLDQDHCCFDARIIASKLIISYVGGFGTECQDKT